MEESFWRRCSTCKKPIGFKQVYQRCNVSTCNQARVSLVFCSVPCWSAHVPVYRHKDAWALEEVAPAAGESPDGAKRILVAAKAPAPTPGSAPATVGLNPVSTKDILVVASKLKSYIKDRSDMNTSADVLDELSDRLRKLCDEAIAHARGDGRKTVMARDF